ncbi:MAG TPA: ABC transporter permease [Ktedonobacteraceae bacterium]|nr:ABC transporter permease [Ktedonobacteraceae bacterium]
MATTASPLTQNSGLASLPAITRLARWRFRRMGHFLFVSWLGMVAMVVLICAGPLFERVSSSASVRAQITSAADGTYITLDAISTHPTQEQLQGIEQVANNMLQHGTLGNYLHTAPQIFVKTPPLDQIVNGKTKPAAFDLVGYDQMQASQHTIIRQGRLPQVTTDGTVEIALSQQAASNLGLQVGSKLQGRFPVAAGSVVWPLKVVGIIAPKIPQETFWSMGDPFSKSSVELASRYYFKHDGTPSYNVLTTSQILEPKVAVMQSAASGGDFANAFVFFLRYPFDVTRLDTSDIPALSQQTTNIDNQLQTHIMRNSSSASDLVYVNVFGTLFTTLEFNANAGTIGQITLTFLLLITLALMLFLVGLMSGTLIEWQTAVIATLRSRGATRQHIFGAFMIQGIVVGLAALLIGPLLAVLLVLAMAQILLSPADQAAINVLTTHPISAIFDVKWYALIAIGLALLVWMRSLHQATKMDIVSFRREVARSKRVPLWRRFQLDLLLALVLLVGFGFYTYFWSLLTQSSVRVDPVIYQVLTAVGFLSTPFLVAAVLLLFLRLFPAILRLATFLVSKKRSAPAVLALAQMERSPRQAARVIILLALAISSACFFLTLGSTKAQHNLDLATFATQGTDFSGPLPASDTPQTFEQLKASYQRLAGVQSVTLGSQNVIELSAQQNASGQGELTVDAVDAQTYAKTVSWPPSYSSQPLADLTSQLASHRASGIANHLVYALVDLATWQRLHLTPGQQFSLPADSTRTSQINYIALAEINFVPGVYDTPTLKWTGMGLLVDYQNYTSVNAAVTGKAASTIAPNYIWLKSGGGEASLASVRNALPGLNDRAKVFATTQTDPNYLEIVGVLYIGMAASLVLAVIGALLLSWLTASTRRTNFAVARALGMESRQIAAILLWEQGFVYIMAIGLGLILATILSFFVGPTTGSLPVTTGNALEGIGNVPPIQLVIPYMHLLLVSGLVTLICLIALLIMARIVSRPSLSQTLRLNED